MMIGTCHFAQVARSASRRSLERWTIWLTANGAAGRSGCTRFHAASSSVIRCSHSSSNDCGRALSAGNEPTTPALHRSEEHTSELQSLMRISYAVFCLRKKTNKTNHAASQKNTQDTQNIT